MRRMRHKRTPYFTVLSVDNVDCVLSSDVTKDWTPKDEDLTLKDKDKDKDLTLKDKDKDLPRVA